MSNWTAMADQWPPVGEWVLTACADSGWPNMTANRLNEGDGTHGRERGLYFWNSGDDFDDVTHWQPLPPMPNKENV